MQAWLYQMRSQADWRPEDYRLKVWEREAVTWPTGRVTSRGQAKLQAGDVLIFFFTKSNTQEPGLHGWALVTKVRSRSHRLQFRALPPTDTLKINPIWNDVIEQVIERVRGVVKQGTVWHVPPTDFAILRDQIRRHER